jgi:hypothetical protein
VRPALANIITSRVPEADLLIDTMTVRPQGNRAFLISDTIRRLKAADIWAKLDVLWMLAAHDAQAARLNWKAPASFALTAVNSPTFTADRGYAGNGTTSYLNTGWKPNNGVQFTQNSAHMMARDNTSRIGNPNTIIGNFTVGGGLQGNYITPRKAGDTLDYGINSNGVSASNANSNGMFLVERTGSAAYQMWRNAVSLGTGTTASQAPNALNIYICAYNLDNTPDGLLTDQISAASCGASLGSALVASYHSVINTYMNAVGA